MPSPTPKEVRRPYASFTTWSLLALAGGLALGLAGHLSRAESFVAIGSVANVVGELWISTLQMIALPLALALTLAATANATTREAGSLGARAIALFLIALAIAACFSAFIVRAAVPMISVGPSATASLPTPPVPSDATIAQPSPAAWWLGLVPRNIFGAAARGDIFPLLLFVILFGIAVAKLPEENRLPLTRLFQGTSQAMLVIVRWLLAATPVGVFALTFLIGLRTGTSWARLLSEYLLLRIGVTVLCVVLLYPVSVLLGRTSLRSFARAVFPAQIVAVSTRSSLAALPALIAGGREHAGFTAAATDFVLPLSVSLFRIGTVIANPLKLVFLAHVYAIDLRPEIVAIFIATEIVFSLSAAGIPNSGGVGAGYRMIPVFVAAGIPVEGVIMLDAVETIPDIFETLANVTGQMSAATILTRNRVRETARSVDASSVATETAS